MPDYKMNATIAKLITDQAENDPGKIAIKHNGHSMTYHELDISSNQIAAYFIANNVGKNDVVAVAMDRSVKLVSCLLGIIKAGAAYLPIDPTLPAERVNYILENSKAKLLCVDQQHTDVFNNFDNKLVFDDIWIKRHGHKFNAPALDYNESDLAYILYTSGSTGQPKGVAIEHRSLLNLLLSVQKLPGISSNDIMLGLTTISFDIAELEIFLPLISGAQLVLVDNDVARDGRALLEIIKKENISIVQATPFTWRMLLQSGWENPLPIKAFCGGEALPKELAHKLLFVCNELWNMYGPTETTIYSLIKKVALDDEVITIGKAIDNTRVYILDEHLNKVPDGQEGEIYIGGEGVAREYVNRPELTNEKFIDDRFSGLPGKIYKTGDIGRVLENGDVLCLGRIDHQIKIRGYRIEAEEIEFQIKHIKGIKDALVVLHEDRLGHKQLVAYVAGNKYITTHQLNTKVKNWKNGLKTRLPEYMVPSTFISLQHIPLMPNGKVDRHQLPPPSSKRTTHNKMPGTKSEAIITKIFLKNTDFDHIGINDNFIDMGVDSLVALMIIVDIEEKFDKRLPLTALAHHPTIKLLARFIDGTSASPYSSLIALKKEGAKVPLYLIHGIGLNLFNFNSMLNYLDADQPVYGLRAAGLDGNSKPLESIQTIAAYYNQEIINHDSIGPYAIAGYSFGGIVAYEMVKQLKEAGKNVEMLAMIDTNVQEAAPPVFIDKLLQKAIRQFGKLAFRLGSFSKQPLANIDYLTKLYTNKVKETMVKFGMLNKYKASGLPKYMQKVVDKLYLAWSFYKLKPYHVKLDLFKAEHRLFYVDDPKFLGWGQYALNGVNVYNVPGDHEDMFRSPNDRLLAEAIQKRLDEIPENAERVIDRSLSA